MSTATYISRAPALTPATAFLELVQPDLERVEEKLNSEITSELRTVHQLAGNVLAAGGKRLRPALVALSARAITPNPNLCRLTAVAASVELVHMATLVHDDVVDNTATRRGQPTANAVFGNGVAVISGDFLLARAMRILAIDGDLRIIRTVSDITIEMSEGEILEILATGDPNISLDHYYEILRKKTACFVEGCSRCGAILGGATAEEEAALAEYGFRLGMAFQIADDLLDYTGDPTVTGKPLGSDLRDARATLPFLLAMADSNPTDRNRLLAAFGNSSIDIEATMRIVQILEYCDAFNRTRDIARQHIDRAVAALSALPPSTARDCFTALTDYVVQRDK